MNTHLDWDALNAYADGELTDRARDDAARHLDACADCRRKLERLRAVLAAAANAPRAIDPPEQAWSAIRSVIESNKVVELPNARASAPARTRLRLAAAAVLLIVASSAVTVLVVGRPATQVAVVRDTVVIPAVGGEPVTTTLARMERGYLDTVKELSATLDASRDKLAPETVRAVERSLKTIDDAIAEARDALMHDPASDVLRDALSRNYQQKVDLLRRASAHASASE